MSLKLKLLICLAVSASGEMVLGAENVNSSALVRQDPSCEAVNAAYAKTFASKAYHSLHQRLNDDNKATPFAETVVVKPNAFERQIHGGKWVRFNPEAYSIEDRGRPKYTKCRFVGKAAVNSIATTHYTSKWHHFPFEARTDIWISNDDGRFVKAIRHYGEQRQFSAGVILDSYDYNPASVKLPLPDAIQE